MYPALYLKRLVIDAMIDNGTNIEEAVSALQRSLNDSFGQQTAFVPFWGFHIDDDITLDFGPYPLCKLGKEGFHDQILLPFQQFRAAVGAAQLDDEMNHLTKQYEHIRNVPILTITYHGASEGAKEFISPIAQHVAEFLQFAMASSARSRENVKIIDHTGTYFGRFTSFMPVLSRDHTNAEPNQLTGPNLRGNPWGPKLTTDVFDDLKSLGALDLLVDVPNGPHNDNLTSMLLRSIQLFSDGERSVSDRQAVIAYVGACEALFGHRKHAELYTCTGIARCLDGDFDKNKAAATKLYDDRSRAVHDGKSPDSSEEARLTAYRTICYVLKNRKSLSSKSAIRQWIEARIPSPPTQED